VPGDEESRHGYSSGLGSPGQSGVYYQVVCLLLIRAMSYRYGRRRRRRRRRRRPIACQTVLPIEQLSGIQAGPGRGT
jgi:hypothetical protein